jgi:aspartyl-tRNA(Asn)/glutamyl-tRNA(Gln) amidotransferase subunit C
MTKKVPKAQIQYIANLAKLQLSEEETERFFKEFNDILNYISQIQECDTEGTTSNHNLQSFHGSVLQEDEPRKSMPKAKALKNANKRTKNGFVKTTESFRS